MACPYCLENSTSHKFWDDLLITNAVCVGVVSEHSSFTGEELYLCGDCRNYWCITTDIMLHRRVNGTMVSPAVAVLVQSADKPSAASLHKFFAAQQRNERAAMRLLFPEVDFVDALPK
jgi:hypothetical protein